LTQRQFFVIIALLFALTMAMALYVWQLRRREWISQRVTVSAKAQHVAPPTSGAKEQVTIYVADDRAGTLRAQSVSVPLASARQPRAESVLRALINIYTSKNSPHPLAMGADIRNVFLVDPGLAVIDLNSPFVDGQVSGILPEELTVASMVETLAANIPGLTRVKILVDGKERSTLAGHIDLSGFFDVSQFAELTKEFSAT